MSTYALKLRDPRWQKKRLQVLDRSEWRCQSCLDSESTLHVHHKQYFKGREPWEYDDDQLVVLCESCHESQHEEPDLLMDVVSRVAWDGPFNRLQVALVIAGFVGRELDESELQLPAWRRLYDIGKKARSAWLER
jgi:hypothetical protein